MPQDRLRSPRAGRGRKTTALTDLEYRVWDCYQWTADDFGVMRCSAITIQNASDALADRPTPDIAAALERIVVVGLAVKFLHQDRAYICDPTWQDFQHVEYPKTTIEPKPDPDAMAHCTDATRRLFGRHPGGRQKTTWADDEPAPNSSQTSTKHDPNDRKTISPRARGREKANASASTEAQVETDQREESARETSPPFERFWAAYPRKVARAAALAQWQKLQLDPVADTVIAGLARAKATRKWREDMAEPEMPHIPHGRTWLHQRRWEDQPSTPPAESSRASGRVPDPVLQLCGRARVKRFDVDQFFAGSTLDHRRDQSGDHLALIIPDDDAREYVIRHFGEALEAVVITDGSRLVITGRAA